MRQACWILVVCFLAGCGSGKRDQLLPLDKAPAELLEAARQSQPDVTFDQVLKQTDGNFEFRGSSDSGRIRKVTVSPEGKVLRTK
jgi:uncharacterized lipoprotein